MPPLECANFLECENKTVCVAPSAPFDLLFGSNPSFFHHIPENDHNSPCLVFFKKIVLAKMAWNAIVCETTDVSRENSIFPIFQKTWFQAILAKKKRKKNWKTEKKTRSTTILWSVKILQSAWILQYVYVPSCGVRCPMWSAKKLWNAKNSEYAWLV